jgi:hypothetical protein
VTFTGAHTDYAGGSENFGPLLVDVSVAIVVYVVADLRLLAIRVFQVDEAVAIVVQAI